MTDRKIGGAWDDDRLAAAFSARDRLRPSAAALIAPTIELVAADRRPTIVRWLPAIRPALAVVAVAVIVGGVAFSGSRSNLALPTTSTGPQTTASIARSQPTATTAPTPRPETAMGLPIISVSDAIAVRDAGVDDRELAVRGWYGSNGCTARTSGQMCETIYDCFIFALTPPVYTGCADGRIWIAANADRGPTISPSFDQLDRSVVARIDFPPSCATRSACLHGPTEVVAIGHFDDRRSTRCAREVEATCRNRFVIDRLDSADERRLPTSAADATGRPHRWTVDDIERVDPATGGAQLLSIQVISSHDKSIAIEPTLGATPTWAKQPAIWIVRWLLDGRLVTHVIADGADQVFELRSDGSLAPHIDCRNTFCQFPAPTARPS